MKKNTDRSRNKGRAGKMWAGAVLLAAGLLLCGCQKGEPFDAAGYVESVLDANYQGKYEEYAAWKFPQRTRQRIWKRIWMSRSVRSLREWMRSQKKEEKFTRTS